MARKKILITSALPYANGPLHFGHIAGAYLPGDCYARYQRLKGSDVHYVCGSDEYGIAITLTAEMAGRTPREHVDIYHGVIKDLFEKLELSFDHYSRTSWEGHIALVQQFFLDLQKNGFIDERVTEQLYSEEDNRFLADRYVVGTCPNCSFDQARGDECPSCGASFDATDLKDPRSKITQAKLTLRPAKHWFLLLDKMQGQLEEWIEKKQWKPNVKNFAKKYIEGLRARAITRDSDWGVPLPLEGTEGKVFYVWFDAPIGYLSASREWAQLQGEPDKWKDYWCDPGATLVHFVGKDNIPFHAAIFPAMIMGQDQPYKLVDELPANEFYNLEGRQFSKSEGWTIDLDAFFSRYTVDQIRYTIAANAPETSDSEFTWKDFQNRCNSELLGKLGNFVHRTLVFAHKQCEGKVPPLGSLSSEDKAFQKEMYSLVEKASSAYEQFSLRRASQVIMELAQAGNIYFDNQKPWAAAKSPDTREQMETTIALCLECVKLLALIASPIIPSSARKIRELLGEPEYLWDGVVAATLPTGQKLATAHVLFTKVEDEQIKEEIEKLHAMVSSHKKGQKEMVSIDDVQKLDLRVASVVHAEPVEKSKKLLKLTVEVGGEERTIVSGIREHYKPEEVVGKKVVIIANLKPAKLMGVESQGMILAGSHDDKLEVLFVEDLPSGSEVS